MRPRFLALAAGEDHDLDDRVVEAARISLPVEHTAPGVRLFLDADTPCVPMPEAGGWIIGTLFDRSSSCRIAGISSAFAKAVDSTGGDHLLRTCWGSYAALWTGNHRGMHLLRDPSAMLPVFYGCSTGISFATSDIALPFELGLLQPDLDWDMVAHGLLYAQLPTRRTHFAGVRELLPGERLALTGGDHCPTLRWRPWDDFASTLPGGDAHCLVADAVDRCVSGWAGTCRSIQLELSGGLDSSILAAALSTSEAAVHAVTIATPQADGDERAYARLVADHIGIPLDAILTGEADADGLAPLARWTPKPRGMRILAGLDRLFSDAARRVGADTIFSGGGGDNVFAFTASTAPVLDAWRALGVQIARHVALDVAMITGATVPSVYRHTLQRLLRPPRRRHWMADRSLLAGDVRCKPHPHPWLDIPRGTPDGKRTHIAAILRIHDVLDAHDRAAVHRMIFPLLSQPVMETCLAIPSWLWVAGGRDRAVARDAFRDRLPVAIVGRGGKGRLESLIIPAFEKARSTMRDRLCGGHLMAAGLLDRAAVEAAFARPLTDRNIAHARLLQLVDAELWVGDMIERRRNLLP